MHIVLYNNTISRTSGVSSRTTKAVKQRQLLRFILLEDILEHSHFLPSDSAFFMLQKLQIRPYCHFMTNDWLVRSSSISEFWFCLKLALYTRNYSLLKLFTFRNSSIHALYPKLRHFIVGDRVSMLMWNDRALQKFLLHVKWRPKMSHANFGEGFWKIKIWTRSSLLPILYQKTSRHYLHS